MKTAAINLLIEPALKAAAEKAAAEDHHSLTGLIEKLLTDYCKKRAVASAPSSSRPPANGSPKNGSPKNGSPKNGSPKAAEMAARTIDAIGDETLPPEERQQRKRRLIRGPKEFRDIRRK
jgi:hypothetical protein